MTEEEAGNHRKENTINDNNKKRTFNIFEMTKEEKQKEYAGKYTIIGLS